MEIEITKRALELVLSFECERCKGPVYIEDIEEEQVRYGRTFCGNCGALYGRFYNPDKGLWFLRIRMGTMYLPPLEWTDLYLDGHINGENSEIWRRQHRTFWNRVGDFIHNR